MNKKVLPKLQEIQPEFKQRKSILLAQNVNTIHCDNTDVDNLYPHENSLIQEEEKKR